MKSFENESLGVAGKILRSIVIKFEVPESKLGLLTSYCVLIIIQQLKSLKF